MSFTSRRAVTGILFSTSALLASAGQARAQCGGMRMPFMTPMQQTPFASQFPMQPQYPLQNLLQQQLLLQQQVVLQNLIQRQQNVMQDLIRRLSNEDEPAVKEALRSKQTPLRLAAAVVVGQKSLPLQNDLIRLLEDRNDAVRQAARRGLVQLSTAAAVKGSLSSRTARAVDFGPAPNASQAGQSKAARKWQEWWDKRT